MGNKVDSQTGVLQSEGGSQTEFHCQMEGVGAGGVDSQGGCDSLGAHCQNRID
jgi:hypothetical protein